MSSFRQNMSVSYEHKDAAMALGAKWDPQQKVWYAPSHESYLKLIEWYMPAPYKPLLSSPISKTHKTHKSPHDGLRMCGNSTGSLTQQSARSIATATMQPHKPSEEIVEAKHDDTKEKEEDKDEGEYHNLCSWCNGSGLKWYQKYEDVWDCSDCGGSGTVQSGCLARLCT